MKIYLSILVLAFLSCKSPQAKTELKEAAVASSNEESLVVIAGGFSSCPDDFLFDKAMRAGKTAEMYNQFFKHKLPVLFNKRTGKSPAIFTICYSGPDNLAKNYTESISGRYAWNLGELKKGQGGVKTFDIGQGKFLRDVGFLSSIKMELRDYFLKKKNEGTTVKLYLIGHSYGGFTSIQLADFFSEHFAGLFTIDPISMLNCQAKDMATKIYSTLTMKHEGCKSAPNDFYSTQSTNNILADIQSSQNKKWWFHTYQNAFPWLHSNSIKSRTGVSPETQLFTKKDFNEMILDGDYHSQLGRNENLWILVASQFARKLPLTQN